MQIALGGPADRAGIQQRDLILKVDGKETNTVADLRNAISEHNIGDTITITISVKVASTSLTLPFREIVIVIVSPILCSEIALRKSKKNTCVMA